MTDNIQYSIFDGPLQALVNENTRSDDWVNATKWCQYFGKEWNDISKQPSFQRFLESLCASLKTETLYEVKGKPKQVWVHPVVAVKLATWLSHDLELLMYSSMAKKSNLDFDWIKNNGTPKEKDLSGFVYLVQATKTNFYKIGLSKDPLKRLSSIQSGTPFEVKIIHRLYSLNCVLLEKALHDYYQAYWLRGEWFDFPISVVKEFVQTANDLDQSIESNLLTGVEN